MKEILRHIPFIFLGIIIGSVILFIFSKIFAGKPNQFLAACLITAGTSTITRHAIRFYKKSKARQVHCDR